MIGLRKYADSVPMLFASYYKNSSIQSKSNRGLSLLTLYTCSCYNNYAMALKVSSTSSAIAQSLASNS